MRVRGGAALHVVCMYAWPCACACVNTCTWTCLCVQARAGKGQDMSAHWESGSFTRRDHFTLPPEAFFPPKAFSCSWLSTCRECNRERKGRIISTYNSPQKYCRKEKKEREGRKQCQRERGGEREGGERKGERERVTLEKKVFVLFLFFLLSSPPPVLTG